MTAVRGGFVLDASVALAARDQAVRLAVPAAFDGECAAGPVRAVRRGRLARDAGEAAWLDLLELSLERIASPASVLAAMGTALDSGISPYDALNVALADELELPSVTADARLARVLAGSPHTLLYVGDVAL